MNIVLDTNVLLISLPKLSPYRLIFDKLIVGDYDLYVTNEIISEYFEIIEKKTNLSVATNDNHFGVLKSFEFPRIEVINDKDFIRLLKQK